MSINVSQAFHRTSANPIDDTITLTKAEMLEINDNLMPDYYFTVCQDDGNIYLYDKSATASSTTGKFTKFEGGDGDASSYVYVSATTLSTTINETTSVTLDNLAEVNDSSVPTDSDIIVGKTIIYDADGSIGIATAISDETVTVTTATKVNESFYDTLVDSEDTELTQRDILKFGDGFTVTDDETNELTEVTPTFMTESDMDDVVTSLPTPNIVTNYDKYSTDEQIIGEWIDESTLYQITFTLSGLAVGNNSYDLSSLSADIYVDISGMIKQNDGAWVNIQKCSPPTFANSTLTTTSTFYFVNSSNVFYLEIASGDTDMSGEDSIAYITVKYTKTTD